MPCVQSAHSGVPAGRGVPTNGTTRSRLPLTPERRVESTRYRRTATPTRPARDRPLAWVENARLRPHTFLLDEATVKSRRAKQHDTGVDLHDRWRSRLTDVEQAAIDSVVRHAKLDDGGRLPAGTEQLARAVIDALEEQRAWWVRAHVTAEVARLTDTPTAAVIEAETERIITGFVNLEPDDDPNYATPDDLRMACRSHRRPADETRADAASPGTLVKRRHGAGQDLVDDDERRGRRKPLTLVTVRVPVPATGRSQTQLKSLVTA